MRTQTRVNILLVELLFAVLFFMLGATVLMRIFGESYLEGTGALLLTEAAGEAQNTADLLAASGDFLSEAGKLFPDGDQAAASPGDDGSVNMARDCGGYRLLISFREETLDKGTIYRADLQAEAEDGTVLINLPVVKYEEAEP